MKRTIAIILLLGYLSLTPFCFLAGALHDDNTLLAHSMPGMAEDMPMHGAESPIGTAGDHIGMYISQTGSIEQSVQLLVLSLLSATLIIFVIVGMALGSFVPLVQPPLYLNRNDIRRFIANIGFMNWLTLSKVSPPRVSLA